MKSLTIFKLNGLIGSTAPQKNFNVLFALLVLVLAGHSPTAHAQTTERVTITGARFAYPLVVKWIEGYSSKNPGANIQILNRGISDPEGADIIIDAYPNIDRVNSGPKPVFIIGKSALLPIANSASSFAQDYAESGITEKEVKELFFIDPFASNEYNKKNSKGQNYSFYKRLQKASIPVTFARHYGFELADIKGMAIAGADEHVVKALLNDPEGITFSIPALIYDFPSGKPKEGLSIIPVDFDGNGRITKDEKEIEGLDQLLDKIGQQNDLGIPSSEIYLYFTNENPSSQALDFVGWVLENGLHELFNFGFSSTGLPQNEIEKLKKLALTKK